MPRGAVLAWLRAIEWPGELAHASSWLQTMVAPWERAFLQIEYDEQVLPYLGIEPPQTRGARAELRERGRCLDALVRSGHAAADRAAAALAWHATHAHERRSFHLKCVLGPTPQLKAYLGIHFEA